MSLTTKLASGPLEGTITPLLALAVPEGGMLESLVGLDRQTDGALRRVFGTDFKGKRDETAILYPVGPASRILLVGMGKATDLTPSRVRRAAAVAGKSARQLGVAEASFYLVPEAGEVLLTESVQGMVEGLAAGAWRFTAMQRPPEDPKPELSTVTILVKDPKAVAAGHRVGSAIAAGHVLARELQVLPANVCTPDHLATTARDLAKRHGFGVTVLDGAGIRAEGMGALMAVGQGSANDPRFIVLEYQGAKGAPVVLVGKGITFDTGGISIKPADRMEDMKFDMSGAAAVLGTFEMLGRLKPKLHVIGLVPSAENMPSSTAYRPGDVIRSHLGKTIEVINTDAEGRLILADALSYARRFKPAAVIDAATLTGAVVIGLGHIAAAVLGTDAALVREVLAAGERSGERTWELPCWDEYRELIKSDIADMKNSGGRAAGTITAAWFLREFAEGYPWAHIDIAGTAYSAEDSPGQVKGPTGMGVRLFSELLLARV
ncbi:MAG: leucyl aminopeptidase [Gemmatimonadota bacterium]